MQKQGVTSPVSRLWQHFNWSFLFLLPWYEGKSYWMNIWCELFMECTLDLVTHLHTKLVSSLISSHHVGLSGICWLMWSCDHCFLMYLFAMLQERGQLSQLLACGECFWPLWSYHKWSIKPLLPNKPPPK